MRRTTLFIGLLSAALCRDAAGAGATTHQLPRASSRGPTNFDGSGQFKFALVNAAGTTTFWSNDNTSIFGSEPTAAVTLPVSKGLYSVLLGDATIPNMVVVPPPVFNNPDVRLRVWFNDGTNGSQLLTPDQRIAAVGYAMSAVALTCPRIGSDAGVINLNGSHRIHRFGANSFFAGTGTSQFRDGDAYWWQHGIGRSALAANASGNSNTALGNGELKAIPMVEHTAVGADALTSDTLGGSSTAVGESALKINTNGSSNNAVGSIALFQNPSGQNNTAIGAGTLFCKPGAAISPSESPMRVRERQ